MIEPSGFETAEIPANSHFRGISVVDSLVTWISGSQGAYLRTIDGGSRWMVNTVSGYTAFDFRDIEAFDGNNAIIMGIGSPGVILKTTNGGETWVECFRDDREEMFLNSIEFWNESSGICIGDPIDGSFYIIRTDDSGSSWKEIPFNNRPEAEKGEYLFAASGSCLALTGERMAWIGSGGNNARIFYSQDKGMTWKGTETPMISGISSAGIFSVYFSDDLNGWAVGGDYTKESEADRNFIISNDGGNSWYLASNLPGGFRSSICEIAGIGQKILLCTGPAGTDYSSNQGNSWISLDSLGYHAMDVGKDGKTVWAAGANGKIGKLHYSMTGAGKSD